MLSGITASKTRWILKSKRACPTSLSVYLNACRVGIRVLCLSQGEFNKVKFNFKSFATKDLNGKTRKVERCSSSGGVVMDIKAWAVKII